ncbi:MAG: phosphatidate cytidylyltransferase [Bacteroidales bacterium]|nr:phosphatidate cytidylyltransferase [Bacteroidales bacterium]
MKTFWIRTASATVYALLFLGSIYSGRLLGNSKVGIAILTGFALFVSLGCAFEYFRIAKQQDNHPNQPLGYLFTALMTVGLGLSSMYVGNALASFGVVSLLTLLVMALVALAVLLVATPVTLMVELWRNSQRPFADVLHTLLPMLYCAIPLGLMPFLHYRMNILVMCIILVWVNDSFAYMGGSLVGKHKMWPKHSPGKSWEGTAIGVLFCLLTALFVGPLFKTELVWTEWLLLGVICSVIGTLGDLVESMLKRSVGLKDSGNIMPGHGGFLDRFDSLMMILPMATLVSIVVILI